MNKLITETLHPGYDHDLKFVEGSESVPLSQTCNKCMQPVSRRNYYKCTASKRCGYYLHKECAEEKDLSRPVHHPLHPQHPLVEPLSDPNYDKSFVCSFCGKTQPTYFLSDICSDDQCDFSLDTTCYFGFESRRELLAKYEIQHFLHDHENHRLSPYFLDYESDEEGRPIYYDSAKCAGCTHHVGSVQKTAAYKCIACDFYLHTECSQVPKEVVQHPSHPHHPLVLLLHDDSDDDQLRCTACLKGIEGGFYLHCNHCPTFNLDLDCYFRFKPTFKYEAHEHPLAYFLQIHDDDARCYACNTPFKYDRLFRCFTCNFNIHFRCLALPNTVNYDDHIHPFTLTTSFKKDGDPTTYYCDICEKQRDPDHGIYLCKECPFVAHFECALSLSTAEMDAHAEEPWRQKIEEYTSEDQEDVTLTNERLRLDILTQFNEEIQKVNDVIKQLNIKEREGEQVIDELQEFHERHANIEDILRRLKQSVSGTNNN